MKDGTLHITEHDRHRWNESQLFNITQEDGQGKINIHENEDFHVVLPQHTGLIHFTAESGALNGPGPSIRGIWTCNSEGNEGQIIAFDRANKTYRKSILGVNGRNGRNWKQQQGLKQKWMLMRTTPTFIFPNKNVKNGVADNYTS